MYDVEAFRSVPYCINWKGYKMQEAAANRSGFFYTRICHTERSRSVKLEKRHPELVSGSIEAEIEDSTKLNEFSLTKKEKLKQ